MAASALRNRDFLIYISGATVSLHGLWIYRVALGWFAWQLTQSEFWVGAVAFSQFAPAVILGPIFGVLADRFDRRHASILVNSACAVNMCVITVLTFMDMATIGVLVATSLVQGMLEGAHTPIRMTLVPAIVERPELPSAIASNSIAFNLSRFVGPALAGIIIASWGVGTAFAINGASYAAIVLAVACIRLRRLPAKQTKKASVWADIGAGFRYVLAHDAIRGLLVFVAVASLFGRGALEMLPAFADAVFKGGASTLAILTSSVGAGAIIAGLLLSRGGQWLDTTVVRIAVITGGMLIALFAVTENFWLAVPLVAMTGIILTMSGIGSQILIQTLVDEDVRGRVSSLWGMIAFGGTAIGSLAVGAAATAFGLQPTVLATGLICAAAAMFAPVKRHRRK